MLNKIINQVTNNPRLGVAIKSETGVWVLPFSRLADIKAKGYNSVTDILNNLIVNNEEKLTIFLKRKAGTSSTFIKNVSVVIASKNNKAVASLETETVGAVESVPTSVSNIQATQFRGLMGVDVGVLDMYAKSQQFNQMQPQLAAKIETIDSLKLTVQKMEIEAMQKNFDIKNLEKEVASKKRPFVSSDAIASFSGLAEMFAPAINKFASAGMKGTQKQEPQEVYSEQKTELLDFIKNPNYADANATYLLNIIQQLETPQFAEALHNLLNQQQPTPTN